MTHSVNSPLPPPTATQSIDPPQHEGGATAGTTAGTTTGAASGGGSATKDAATNEAAAVGQSAKQAGSQVASTAADQARQVAGETKRQAQDLVDQGRTQLREQAVTQQQKAAQGLSSLAGELRGLANGTSEGAPGPARDLIEQASDKVDEFSSWLQNREPADLLDEVRRFARRKPGAFLLGAAAAGVLAGRLTSGIKAAHSDQAGSGRHSVTTGTAGNYVDPAPAYTGYTGTETATGTYGSALGEPAGTGTTPGTGAPLPPPPYGTVPPAGSVVPPTTPAGWDDPTRSPGEVR
jgi:hypothetical protein